MNPQSAQQLIIVSLMITLASTGGAASNSKVKTKPKNKPGGEFVAGFFAMLGCSLIADYVSPEAGAGIAVMVAGVAFTTYGLPTIESYYGKKEKK